MSLKLSIIIDDNPDNVIHETFLLTQEQLTFVVQQLVQFGVKEGLRQVINATNIDIRNMDRRIMFEC